jgi:hypothetical protein
LDERIDVAGVIIGLPRTGSTILQRLLASSPQLTSGYWWEVTLPLRLPDENSGDPRPRQALAKKLVAEFLANWPGFVSIDPIDAMAVAEEVILLDKSFLSSTYDSMFNIPSYGYWMAEADHHRAYQELRTWLQVLQHQAPERRDRRWILKTPHHLLGGLDGLMGTFADAKIIMTHRAIEDVLPSYCSMCTSFTAPFSSTFNKATYGAHWSKRFTDALRKLMAVRATAAGARFIDVHYQDTISRPVEVCDRVMQSMGLSFTTADEAAARKSLEVNDRDKRPPHRYTPEEFGLDRARIAADFEFYTGFYLFKPQKGAA